jgi:uncharacterized protein YgfB (UPF0149 family)
MADLPSFDDVAQASRQGALGTDPSELHGALAGWLAGGGSDEQDWTASVLADPQLPPPQNGDALDQLRLVKVAQ